MGFEGQDREITFEDSPGGFVLRVQGVLGICRLMVSMEAGLVVLNGT
jgi:hypothetical protein